jgi:hypothetical protein
MAQSLQTLRNSIITSVHGRRLALDKDDFLVGPPEIKRVVADYTSGSTGTEILPYGVHSFQLTTLSTQTFVIRDPVPGVPVTIFAHQAGATNLSSNWSIKRKSAAFEFESSEGSTMVTINMSSRAQITLMGITSTRYQVIGRNPMTSGTTTVGPFLNGTS